MIIPIFGKETVRDAEFPKKQGLNGRLDRHPFEGGGMVDSGIQEEKGLQLE